MLEAMRRDNLAKILAEPTLITISGRPAYFQSGGEIPVITSGGVGVAPNTRYKNYGTEIDFVPIVLGNGKIRLEVRPRISEIDASRSTGTAEAFSVRTVDTGVELTAGQTLAIAGLIQSRVESSRVGLPWVSELPYLGMMFRRTVEERNEIELLVLVTPELVSPLNPEDVPRLGPGMQTGSPTDWQLFVRGHVEVPICCQNCGGTGCSQCEDQAAAGQPLAEPGMIGGDGQFIGAGTPYSPAEIDWRRTSAARRARQAAAPVVSLPGTAEVSDSGTPALPMPRTTGASDTGERSAGARIPAASDGVSPARSQNRSSRSNPSATSEPDSSSPLPGIMGPIGYDVVE
jgi:pilus assembly protein CpaC